MEKVKMTREEVCEYLAKTRIEHEPVLRFENILFAHQDLSDIAFMDCDIVNCTFYCCNLTDANFSCCFLGNVEFSFCDMTHTNFSRCHFTKYWFDMCDLDRAILSHSVLKKGGIQDCRLCECDMMQTYQYNTSYTRGCIAYTTFEYSTLIDVAHYQTEFVEVNYHEIDCHHITVDNPTFTDIDLKPFGDEITVYGGYDDNNPPEPVEKYKEFTVHLNVNTKGEAQVTLVEEV